MNVGIITHHAVINQGAIMQMYAMKRWLEENGHTPSVLKYTKVYDFEPTETGKYNISAKYIPFYIREYVIKKGIGLSWFNVKKQILYKKYIKENFDFKSYATDKSDAVVVGSDEVFSLAAGCNMMMYGHCVNTKHIISFAPSFGQTDMARIEQFNCKELITSGLKKFDYVSVRDVNSQSIVKSLTGIDAPIVCDPVILYDFSKEHADISRFKLKGKKYLLVYSLDRWMTTHEEIEAIKSYAEKKGYITVSAGTYHKWCDKNIVCNPIEWLEVFRGAQEVITDTFHGSVLSMITNRPTVYYVRDLNSNKLMSLYKYLGIENRVMTTVRAEEIERIQGEATNFEELNRRLSLFRETSAEFLKKALDEAEKSIANE